VSCTCTWERLLFGVGGSSVNGEDDFVVGLVFGLVAVFLQLEDARLRTIISNATIEEA
jgi:hypothetical protein